MIHFAFQPWSSHAHLEDWLEKQRVRQTQREMAGIMQGTLQAAQTITVILWACKGMGFLSTKCTPDALLISFHAGTLSLSRFLLVSTDKGREINSSLYQQLSDVCNSLWPGVLAECHQHWAQEAISVASVNRALPRILESKHLWALRFTPVLVRTAQ